MKKIIALIMTMIMMISCFGLVAEARVGDKIGTAYHTDIVAYINNCAIPSYAVNGQSVIVAEDLRNFGFDVVWNPYNRTLTISRNGNYYVSPMYVDKSYTSGAKFTNILETDIRVYAGGRQLTSYAMNGYTMIPMEELTMFGSVNWVPADRALVMTVDGLQTFFTGKQRVGKKYMPGTTAPDYGWYTQSVCMEWDDDSNGDSFRVYYSSGTELQQYIDYIKSLGWRYDVSIPNAEGRWFTGYINKSKRIGIAVSEAEGIVTVQVKTDLDAWKAAFDG